jgi:hypothetical protein
MLVDLPTEKAQQKLDFFWELKQSNPQVKFRSRSFVVSGPGPIYIAAHDYL